MAMWSEYLREDLPQAMARQELVLVGPQVQDDVGAARRPSRRSRPCSSPSPVALPAHAVLGGQAGAARDHRDPVGDDEARSRSRRRTGRSAARPWPGRRSAAARNSRVPRLGDGAEVVDDLLPGHADAVVGDRDRPRRRVEADPDCEARGRPRTARRRSSPRSAACRRRRRRWRPARAGRSPCSSTASGSSGAGAARPRPGTRGRPWSTYLAWVSSGPGRRPRFRCR